jgi:uncharacterized protein YecE (DUF72 family)
MGRLVIGTCSWKYPSWEGLVYVSRTPLDFLTEYARRYRSVEVDQWFWSLGKGGIGLPSAEVVDAYDRATDAGFTFTVKCPNALTLTHHYAKTKQLQENQAFLDPALFMAFYSSLGRLHAKVGLYIFQFEYLNKAKMPDRSTFMSALQRFFDALPPDLPYAVEIRNPRWIDSLWLESLTRMHVAPVLLQGYWMDDMAAMIDRQLDHLGPVVCLRLHGDDRDGIEEQTKGEWNAIVRPKDEELVRIAASITRLLQGDRVVYLNVNNHYEGSAPLTIDKLKALLGAQP